MEKNDLLKHIAPAPAVVAALLYIWATYITSMPVVAVSFFLMWFSGIVFSYIFLGTHPKFEKKPHITQSLLVSLAIGIVPGLAIQTLYHYLVYRSMITRLDDLALSALPASLILCFTAVIALIWRLSRP